MIDPRGLAAVQPLAPAQRPASLAGRRILLVDNGKLLPAYGNYAALWDAVRAHYAGATFVAFADDLLTYADDTLEPLAVRLIAEHKPDVAILALADAGVSMPTALLVLALERQGVPTALLTTVLGARFAGGILDVLAPGLLPVALDTVRTDSRERVTELVTAAMPEIERRLTGTNASAVTVRPAAAFGASVPAESVAAAAAMHAFQDWAEREGLGDGLPLIPPTAPAVDAILAEFKGNPDDVIFGPAVTSGRVLRVRDAAANAAMTACPPQAFPVIVAALRAMARPAYRLSQTAITTHPSGNAVVFSGRDAAHYGLSGGPGCLGPGHRGNAATGRAVALSVLSVFGARPGGSDLTTFGSPAEFTYCFAELAEESPWPTLADEIGGGRSGVLVTKAEGPRNILEHLAMTPEGIIEALAATATGLGSNNAWVPGDLLVIVNPEHANIFAEKSWTRADVAAALFERARIPRAVLEGKGVVPIRPPFMRVMDAYPCVRSPADVHIVVAGAHGPQSMVALPWGFSRAQWHAV